MINKIEFDKNKQALKNEIITQINLNHIKNKTTNK